MIVSQILNSKAVEGVLTLPSQATVAEAAEVMSDRRFGTIVVSDDDGATAAGILSERDIVREIGRNGAGCLAQPVASLMTAKLVTASPSDTSDAVLTQMTEGRFRHMPVLDANGQLIGLISIGDVVKARLSQLAMERDALEGMVMGH